MPRQQFALIPQTPDDMLHSEHPIRMFDAVLSELDWSSWEKRYHLRRGQPPIHPRLVAGVILWGLIKNLRSSRQLEDATRERLDCIWFLEGRTIDHSTFAEFRQRFGKELKALNGEICRLLVDLPKGRGILELIIDGTRIRANSDRNGAKSAKDLEKWIAKCSEEMQRKMEEWAAEDEKIDRDSERIATLEAEIERLKSKESQYLKALQTAQERDLRKKEVGEGKEPVRVPVTDPESVVLPNKEGGYAPNYTTTAVVDSESGAVYSCDVMASNQEAQSVEKALDDTREILGTEADRLTGDSAYNGGKTLAMLDLRQVQACVPIPFKISPLVKRDELSQPVSEETQKDLPLQGGKLDKSNFIYDAQSDCYYCPMGQKLSCYQESIRKNTQVKLKRYACPGTDGCPLAQRCAGQKSKHRTVVRDEHQDLREQAHTFYTSEEGRKVYRRRAPKIEGLFAQIKQHLGIRQFLYRGLQKVQTEWQWVCIAVNLKRLLQKRISNPLPA